MLAAWYQTVVLIGSLPTGDMLLGTLFGIAYYAYLIALAAGALRGVIGAVLLTDVVVMVEPLVGLIGVISP